MLNKVPEVTLIFWTIKILSTTVGETGADYLAVHVGLGDRRIRKAPAEGPVLRLQIGLEDIKDLKADLERALSAAAAV